MITALPIAHAGHWFEGALYLAPVVILVLVLLVKGHGEEDDEEGEGGEPVSRPDVPGH